MKTKITLMTVSAVMWSDIDKAHAEILFSELLKLIQQGKKEGIFREYPEEVILEIFVSAVKTIMKPDFLMTKKYSFAEALKLNFEIIFQGVLSGKGKKIFEKSYNRTN